MSFFASIVLAVSFAITGTKVGAKPKRLYLDFDGFAYYIDAGGAGTPLLGIPGAA